MEEHAMISPGLLLAIVIGYFAVLIGISYLTAGKGDNDTFFKAGKSSPWYLVAWGMIGASLSGVTFVSIPGVVGAGGLNQQLSYMQVVFGYLLGYVFIATVLLPLYYKLGLTSIYEYLAKRFGKSSYLTGAAFFQLSRIIGASFRLYLVAIVLDMFVLGPLGFPVWGTVAVTLLLIYLYTFKGGMRTVVYTDTLQTFAMLAAVGVTLYALTSNLGGSIFDIPTMVKESGLDQMFFFGGGWGDANNFWKQFFAGALLTIVMTGLDQDMMQKNLTCRSLGDAQKNMFSLSLLLVPINLIFLSLGILLYSCMAHIDMEIPAKADQIFPTMAISHLPPAAGITFVIGLIAAAYSSADSALTSLTTSFCVDFLGFERESGTAKSNQKRTRNIVHIGFAVVLFVVILIFYTINDDSVINSLFRVAGLTYGPLLGLFAFGLSNRRMLRDRLVPVVCVIAPILSWLIDSNSVEWLNGFKFGFLLLALNGVLTFLGLWLLSIGVEEEQQATPIKL
ncbi:MAG: sodium:solute symporter [Saprospiraceae bacterium]